VRPDAGDLRVTGIDQRPARYPELPSCGRYRSTGAVPSQFRTRVDVYWAAVTASTRDECQTLASALLDVPQHVLPVRDRGATTFTSPDGRTALVEWGVAHPGSVPDDGVPRPDGASIVCETGVARVNSVYTARDGNASLASNRASLLAAALGRLRDISPTFVASFLNFEFGIDAPSPWDGIEAASACQRITIGHGKMTMSRVPAPAPDAAGTPAEDLARALCENVAPLRHSSRPVVVSLTGGKDSRLIAAVLKVAGVDFTTRTHGTPDHPDVEIASTIARELGVPHEVSAPPVRDEAGSRFLEVDIEARLRSSVLLADGQLSAFENLGRARSTATARPQLGGQGGEILRGGYNRLLVGRPRLGALHFYRRLAYVRFGLLAKRTRRRYVTSSSTRWLTRTATRTLDGLEDFFVTNRAGRWSAAARSVTLLRSPVVQPFFVDAVIAATRRASMRERMEERLMRDVLRSLVPTVVDIPFAGEKWAFETTASRSTPAPSRTRVPARGARDWRLAYGPAVATYFRDYVLADAHIFDFLDRARVERALSARPQDPRTAWCLATLTTLTNGDWLRTSTARHPLTVPLK
jgi:asparagine synthase (glutamine-hydrolysing)